MRTHQPESTIRTLFRTLPGRAAIAVALAAVLGAAANAPAPPDLPGFRLDAGRYVPDTPAGDARATPWDRPWPPMPGLDENPVTPEKVTLGRLLFFDPVVSGDNTTACADCHHPAFGLSDARTTAMGFGGRGAGPERTGGLVLGRNSPTLWNAGFNHAQFWDGRANDLEHQADFPIQAPDEMNQDPDELVFELQEIPEYVRLFEAAFGHADGETLTYENAVRAITVFERTLLSVDAPFDAAVRGDSAALTDQQKRGFRLFRSERLNCIECHVPPTFTSPGFHVIGVPEAGSPDPGRAKVPGEGPFGAFKTPTLRNIALTAPYMHNGAFDTLAEVIDFYARGAGRAVEGNQLEIDARLRPFTLTDTEKADLVAFLHALTDDSRAPSPPERVPSGLPVTRVTAGSVRQPVE